MMGSTVQEVNELVASAIAEFPPPPGSDLEDDLDAAFGPAKAHAKEPESEWRERFGKMVGPWSGQHCLYFVDRFYNWYTWPSPLSTVGSVICIRELSEQINFVRGMRPNVNPVCELGIADFPTGYGMRQRPHLVKIRDWVILGPQGALPPADSAPEIAPSDVGGAPLDAQSVTPPSAKEVTGDEIMF